MVNYLNKKIFDCKVDPNILIPPEKAISKIKDNFCIPDFF